MKNNEHAGCNYFYFFQFKSCYTLENFISNLIFCFTSFYLSLSLALSCYIFLLSFSSLLTHSFFSPHSYESFTLQVSSWHIKISVNWSVCILKPHTSYVCLHYDNSKTFTTLIQAHTHTLILNRATVI
jgi:hypothetical protein